MVGVLAAAEELPEVLTRQDRARVLGRDEVAECFACQLALLGRHRIESRLRMAGERSTHATERLVRGASELLEVPIAKLPQLGCRERDQRERARLIGDLLH